MAYFPNGSAGAEYENRFCGRCIHGQSEDRGCPVMGLHLLWNYQQVTNPHQIVAVNEIARVKQSALNNFIPERKDGEPAQCTMFLSVHQPRPRRTRAEYPTLFTPGTQEPS